MDVKIQAALIASIVTILGIFLKDFVFHKLMLKRELDKERLDVYKRYAEPLAKSSESLFWRLNEVYNVRGRAHFLMRSDTVTEFENYKYISTLYRLASLLGWVYAIKKEQSYLKPIVKNSINNISSSLQALETALSDGPHVEIERLKRISELWELNIPDDQTSSLSISLERILKTRLKKCGVKLAVDLDFDNLLGLCRDSSDFLCQELNFTPLNDDRLKKMLNQAAKFFSIREAWIYRDWQAGIGELMLIQSESSVRDYDVLGYKKFELMLKSDDEETSLWISRIANLFENLDISLDDGQDVRVKQLGATFKAIAKLIESINNSELDNTPFSVNTLKTAENLIKTKDY